MRAREQLRQLKTMGLVKAQNGGYTEGRAHRGPEGDRRGAVRLKELSSLPKGRAHMQNALLVGLTIVTVLSYLFDGFLSFVFHIFICSIQR